MPKKKSGAKKNSSGAAAGSTNGAPNADASKNTEVSSEVKSVVTCTVHPVISKLKGSAEAVIVPLSPGVKAVLAKDFAGRLSALGSSTGATIERVDGVKNVDVGFVIRGDAGKVSSAKKQLAKFFPGEVTVTVSVPSAHHPFVSGSRGRVAQKISNDSLSRVKIPVSGDRISITGSPEACAAAESSVLDISNGISKNGGISTIAIEREFIPIVAGKKHVFVQQLQREHNVDSLVLPRIDGNSNKISVRGTETQIRAVQDALEKRFAEVKAETTVMQTTIAAASAARVIGPAGRTIHEICEETACHVGVENISASQARVSIRGLPNDAKRAAAMISETTSSNSAEMHVPCHLHRFISGYKGANLSAISNETLTHVRAPPVDSDVDAFTIEGKAVDVRKARKKLETAFAAITTTTLKIPSEFYSFVTGNKGERIQAIRKKHFVLVDIPFSGNDDIAVVVTGIAGHGLEAAADEIRELAAEKASMPVRIEVEGIPADHFRYIIGPKGVTLRKVMEETETRIKVPSAGRKGNDGETVAADSESAKIKNITVEGLRDNAERARARLLDLSAECADLPVTIDLPVPAEYVRFLVGQGSKLVAALGPDGGELTVRWPPSNKIAADAKQVVGRIRGPPKAAKRLKADFDEFISGLTSREVRVDASNIAYVIGPKGSRIQKVMSEYNVVCNIPDRKGDAEKEKPTIVTIIGSKSDTQTAAAAVSSLSSEKDALPVTRDYAMSAAHQYIFVLGEKELAKNVEAEHDVTLHFAPASMNPAAAAASADGNSKTTTERAVRIHGSPAAIDAARSAMDEICKSIVDLEVKIPANAHSYVIGPKGSRIKELNRIGNAHIMFPKNKGVNGEVDDVVHVVGVQSTAKAIREGLLSLAKEHSNLPVTIECSIPRALHRTLIGPEGRNVKEVQSQTSTEIHFPTGKDLARRGKARGRGKKGAKAAAEGEDKDDKDAKKEDAEEAGTDAAKSDNEGEVADEETDSRANIIRIRGQAEDCNRAAEKLRKLADSIISIDIEIPSAHIPYVIGPGGKKVEGIRESTGAMIKISGGPRKSKKSKGKGKGKGKEKEDGKEAGGDGEVKEDKEEDTKDDDDKKQGDDEKEMKEEKKEFIRAKATAAEEISSSDNGGMTLVKISGIRQHAEKAAKQIRRLASEKARISFEASVVMDPSMIRHVVGSKGARRDALSQEFSCRINIPRGSDDPRLIRITGEKNKVNACAKSIVSYVEGIVADNERRAREAEARAKAKAEAAAAAAAKGEGEGSEDGDAPADENGSQDVVEEDLSNPFEGGESVEKKDANNNKDKKKKELQEKKKKKDINVAEISWPGIGNSNPISPSKIEVPFWPRPDAKEK